MLSGVRAGNRRSLIRLGVSIRQTKVCGEASERIGADLGALGTQPVAYRKIDTIGVVRGQQLVPRLFPAKTLVCVQFPVPFDSENCSPFSPTT